MNITRLRGDSKFAGVSEDICIELGVACSPIQLVVYIFYCGMRIAVCN